MITVAPLNKIFGIFWHVFDTFDGFHAFLKDYWLNLSSCDNLSPKDWFCLRRNTSKQSKSRTQLVKKRKKILSCSRKIVTQGFKTPAFTIFTYTIMHLVYRPKFCITIVSNFPWVLQSSQEKSKTIVMQNYGG